MDARYGLASDISDCFEFLGSLNRAFLLYYTQYTDYVKHKSRLFSRIFLRPRAATTPDPFSVPERKLLEGPARTAMQSSGDLWSWKSEREGMHTRNAPGEIAGRVEVVS